jgi:hypothetical protein
MLKLNLTSPARAVLEVRARVMAVRPSKNVFFIAGEFDAAFKRGFKTRQRTHARGATSTSGASARF